MMAKRKRTSVGGSKAHLPKFIELIDEKTGSIKEFDIFHASRILGLQKKSRLGTYQIFNTQLYTYDEGSNTIVFIETSQGDTITEQG